jgi:hypothetical protein
VAKLGTALHGVPLSDRYESATLLIKLYELRRDDGLRRARDWFVTEFHPQSAREVFAMWMGTESARYRMVTSYWDMAASFVNHGAIDADMFHDADLEHVAVYAKLEPFLAELRELSRSPTYLAHLERLVLSAPDAAERVARMRRYVEHKANTYRRQ